MALESAKAKVYTKKELRILYGVSRATFGKWMKEVFPDPKTSKNKLLTPQMVKLIFEKIGEP
jgi:hypothetical protein